MQSICLYALITKLLHTSNVGAVYCFYIFAFVALVYSLLKIKAIDFEERKEKGKDGIHLGAFGWLFCTETKCFILAKYLILELVIYVLFLATIVLASISWFLEAYFISMFAWFWLLAIIAFTSIIYIAYIKSFRPKDMVDF